MRTGFEGTSWRKLGMVAVMLAALLVGLLGSPAEAAVARSDFLPKSVVKARMGGTGTWYRAVQDPNVVPLGSDPAACRSDLPLSRARETRAAWYGGSMPASPAYYGLVKVTIAQFKGKLAAQRAIRKISRWVRACPTVVEWDCTQCDGIAEYRRKPAKRRDVGAQSYTWREKSLGMGTTNGRAIAARRGRTVVIVVASHQTDPTIMTPAEPPTWRTAVRLARRSLNRATA